MKENNQIKGEATKMEQHKAELKEGEEFCTICGFTPENGIHTDCKNYGDWD